MNGAFCRAFLTSLPTTILGGLSIYARRRHSFASIIETLDPHSTHLLVFIPGRGGKASDFDWLRGKLRKAGLRTNIFIPPLPNDRSASISTLAQQIYQSLKYLFPQCTYTLIGYSKGGLVAQELALLLPSKVFKIITIGTPLYGTTSVAFISDKSTKMQLGYQSPFLLDLQRRFTNFQGIWVSLTAHGDYICQPATTTMGSQQSFYCYHSRYRWGKIGHTGLLHSLEVVSLLLDYV